MTKPWQSPFPIVARLFLLAALALSACSSLGSSSGATATAAPAASPEATTAAGETQEGPGAVVLSVWVPPQFDPNGGELAANMLQQRLDEFSSQYSQLRIEVRVKAESGTGGLLDSLITARIAAPLAMADLVLLPQAQLASAAENDTLVTFNGLSDSMQSDDWYDFAQAMADIDGQIYGLPFAVDALVLAYRPTAVEDVPETWNELLADNLPIGFAAADPQAVFALSQILDAPNENEDETFPLSTNGLSDFLNFLASGREGGVFPFWLSQYETTDQSWQAFTEGTIPMVAAWSSRTFDSRNVNVSAAPLPTQDGQAFTLVKGWTWAISTPHSEREELAAELADYLTTPEFLAQWSAAAGLLPPRRSSLAAWSPDERQALASQIVEEAQPLPREAEISLWGTQLSQAVVGLLKQELSPDEALQSIVEALSTP